MPVRRAACSGLALWVAVAVTAPCCATARTAGDLSWVRGQWKQGSLLVGHAPVGTRLRFDGHDVRLTAYGTFVIGLDRNEKSPARISVTFPGRRPELVRHAVAEVDWPVQRIDGLPAEEVTPPPRTLARIHREAAEIRAARADSSAQTGFAQQFIWPVTGPISSVFGSQRILDGQPRQPHYGVDIAVPDGTPLKAPAAGVVSLVARDLYFTGKTLMIDHGHGVQSVFAHLSRILVRDGQRVRQGQVVALTGQSGRATGPNLHWGVSWFDSHVDPAALAGPMPGRVESAR